MWYRESICNEVEENKKTKKVPDIRWVDIAIAVKQATVPTIVHYPTP